MTEKKQWSGKEAFPRVVLYRPTVAAIHANVAFSSDPLQQPERGAVLVGFDLDRGDEPLDQLQATAALVVLASRWSPASAILDLDNEVVSRSPRLDLDR